MTTNKSSLVQGITALRLMVESGHSWGVTPLSKALGMPKSSTHRLLQTLVELNFVQKIDETKRYTLCADIFGFVHEIASNFGRNSDLEGRLNLAAKRLGCSIYLSMLGKRDSYVICAAGDEGNTTKLGSHAQGFATSAGKILIAQLPESKWSSFAPNPDGAEITPYTNRDMKRYFAQLKKAKADGIAWNQRESSKEHVSLATFVREPFITQPRLAVALLMRHDILYSLDKKELEQSLRELAKDLEGILG